MIAEYLKRIADIVSKDLAKYERRVAQKGSRLSSDDRKLVCLYADTLGRMDKALIKRELHDKEHAPKPESLRATVLEIIDLLRLASSSIDAEALKAEILDKLKEEG